MELTICEKIEVVKIGLLRRTSPRVTPDFSFKWHSENAAMKSEHTQIKLCLSDLFFFRKRKCEVQKAHRFDVENRKLVGFNDAMIQCNVQ